MFASLSRKLPVFAILFYLILQTTATFAGDIPRHFEPGFILTHNGDTLRGFVWNPRGAVFHLECRFVSAPGEEVQHFTPREIKGFGFETNRLAISRTINMENLLRQYDKDLSGLEPNVRLQAIREFFNNTAGGHNIDTEHFILEKTGQSVLNQPLFLRVAIEGELSLYLYKNQMFVYKRGEDQAHLLFQTVSEIQRDSRTFHRKNKEYIAILRLLTSDCNNMTEGLENLRLSFNQVSRIVEDYNNCSKQPQRILNEDPTNIRVTFGFSLLSGNQMVRFENNPQFFPDSKYNSSAKFTINPGVFANVVFHKTRMNIGASFGIIYNQYNHDDFHYLREVHPDGIYTIEEQYLINMNYVKMPAMLTIRPSGIPLQPAFLMGLTYNLNFRTDNKLVENTTFHQIDEVRPRTDNDYFFYNWSTIGFIAGIELYHSLGKNIQLVTGIKYDRFTNPITLNQREVEQGTYKHPPATTGNSVFSTISLNLGIKFGAF